MTPATSEPQKPNLVSRGKPPARLTPNQVTLLTLPVFLAGAALVAARPAVTDFRTVLTAGAASALVSAVIAAFLVPPVRRRPEDGMPMH